MSRDLTVAADAAFQAAHVPLCVLVELDWPSGVVRVTNAGHSLSWDGHTWDGIGAFGGIDPIEESGDVAKINGLALRLSGIPTSVVAAVRSDNVQGRSVKVWLAPLTAAHTFIADPVLVFSGRLDTMSIEVGATATVTVTAESRMADWDRPRVRRYNNADQQLDYPADTGLRYVEALTEKTVVWGR